MNCFIMNRRRVCIVVARACFFKKSSIHILNPILHHRNCRQQHIVVRDWSVKASTKYKVIKMKVYDDSDISHNTRSDVTVEPRKLYTTINSSRITLEYLIFTVHLYNNNQPVYSTDNGDATGGWVMGWWGTSSPSNRMEKWNKVATCCIK